MDAIINNIATATIENIISLRQELEKVSAIPDTSFISYATTHVVTPVVQQNMRQYNKQMEIQSVLGFHAVAIKQESDNRAQCDSKTTTIFEVSRHISREEFSSFLKEMRMNEKERGQWYLSYTIVEGDGDKWTYTYVNPYTD